MQKAMSKKIQQNWNKIYQEAPETLEKMSAIKSVACAFNTCIDSVVKISGNDILKLTKQEKLSLSKLQKIDHKSINTTSDFIKGVFLCFTKGIAEEWTSDKPEIFNWLLSNIGIKKMQIGGQAGIVANTLSLTDIKKIIVHSNALTKEQAKQFFPNKNLLSFDEKGQLKQASLINRDKISSIHWIIEFDKNDKITIEEKTFICPKSNRFIVTYDPPLFNFKLDKTFIKYTTKKHIDYYFLSGYQALSYHNHGLKHIKKSEKIISLWKEKNPNSIIHLEIASTQDKIIRKAITTHLANKVDSIGINDREVIDILEVIKNKKLSQNCSQNPDSINLLKAILKIKQKTNCPRIQLHMLGLYITIQDRKYPISPAKIRNGMILAATAAASKAYIGSLTKKSDILQSQKNTVSEKSLSELEKLSEFLNSKTLLQKGFCTYKNLNIIAIPTIIIEKPKTLVGMGDTISSFSIIGAG